MQDTQNHPTTGDIYQKTRGGGYIKILGRAKIETSKRELVTFCHLMNPFGAMDGEVWAMSVDRLLEKKDGRQTYHRMAWYVKDGNAVFGEAEDEVE